MRLVTFSDAAGTRIGVQDPATGTIVDLTAGTRPPRDMTEFIRLGRKGLARARRAVRSAEGRIPLAAVKLHAPILKKGDVVAVTIEPIGTLENPVS